MSKTNIMVVEDEYIVAADLKERLETMGYQVGFMVQSGQDAIDCIEMKTPDLIIMDIVLSGEMDGIETSMAIKQKKSIPVVFLTAHATESILDRAKLSEPFGYVLKPFKDRELQAVIEMALYKANMSQKLRDSNSLLKKALSEVTALSGMLPICSTCKKIRDDEGYWHQVEMYFQEHTDAKFSHSICPDCAEKLYPEITNRIKKRTPKD